MVPLAYAGIGARKTPPPVLAVMRRLAAWLASKGWHLNTGGADGADRAFASGAPCGARTVFLPWRGYNGWRGPGCVSLSEDAHAYLQPVAAAHHPAWDRCRPGVRKLHARNIAVLAGLRTTGAARAVVCWTEHGRVTGGTGMALRIAAALDIPVLNLAFMPPRDVCLALCRLAAEARDGAGPAGTGETA